MPEDKANVGEKGKVAIAKKRKKSKRNQERNRKESCQQSGYQEERKSSFF